MTASKITLSPEIWFEVNRFAGWAFVVAAGFTALLLMMWSGTMLKPAWRQLLALLIPLGIAVGASLWYERNLVPPKRDKRREED